MTRGTVTKFGLADRFSFVEGDLMETDFGIGYHAATLDHILHSVGETRSRALLAKNFEALASGGTIAIAEFLVSADRTGPVNGHFFAVNMLVNTDVGETYSSKRSASGSRLRGFVNPRTPESPGPSPLILATRH